MHPIIVTQSSRFCAWQGSVDHRNFHSLAALYHPCIIDEPMGKYVFYGIGWLECVHDNIQELLKSRFILAQQQRDVKCSLQFRRWIKPRFSPATRLDATRDRRESHAWI